MLKLSGKILRKRREKLGISEGQVARQTGKSTSVISRYENGHLSLKNIVGTANLLEAYGYKIIDTLEESK
jgi:predicted transcriptional regulator